MINFFAGLSYLLGLVYALYSFRLHFGPVELITDSFSREELYTMMGAGFAFFGMVLELMAQNESDKHWTE